MKNILKINMITTVILTNPTIRDAIVSLSAGIRQTHEENNIIFYQKNSLIFAFSQIATVDEIYQKAVEEYQSEEVFIIEAGRSVDTEHEIGDVILPSVFFDFNPAILETEINKENQDKFITNPKFLEIFDEHKDYFVEYFGLTIGGIAVQNVPNNPEINEKLMSVYSADVYVENSLSDSYNLIENSTIPTLLLVSIIDGKKSSQNNKNPNIFLAQNLLTTIRLLQDDENL